MSIDAMPLTSVPEYKTIASIDVADYTKSPQAVNAPPVVSEQELSDDTEPEVRLVIVMIIYAGISEVVATIC